MAFKKTKYTNNERIVGGTVTVTANDVVLLCDTSSAPVIINLLSIPSSDNTYSGTGRWSTQYKLCIVDYAQNASVNNITIVAPSGFKINATQSQIINSNGGSMLVRIVSNVDYIGFFSYNTAIIPSEPLGGVLAISSLGGTTIPYTTGVRVIGQGVTQGLVPNPNTNNVNPFAVVASYGDLINSFNISTATWTAPATGYYDFNLLFSISADRGPFENLYNAQNTYGLIGSTLSPSGNATVGATPFNLNDYIGAMIAGITDPTGGTVVCCNTGIVYFNTSQMVISASYTGRFLSAGQQYVCKLVNNCVNGNGYILGQQGNSIHFSATHLK